MVDKKAFFTSYKKSFGKIAANKKAVLASMLDQLSNQPPGSLEQAAYMLATVKHETNDTYLPVKEAYWVKNAEAWRKRHLRYYPWYGRGYVQLTWKTNYVRAGRELGFDLTTDPDAVMKPEISYAIMLEGMLQGWFTGKSLDDYINTGRKDYVGARKIINGTDKAKLIAGYAKKFATALKSAGYSVKKGALTQATLLVDMPTLRHPFENTAATKALSILLEADVSELDTTVKTFQRGRGLKPDGVVGPVTWKALLAT